MPSPLQVCLVVFLRCSPVFQLAKTTPGDMRILSFFLSHWLVVFARRCQDLLASPQALFLVSSITLLWTHHFIRAFSCVRLRYPSVGVRPQTYQDNLAWLIPLTRYVSLDFRHSHRLMLPPSRPLLFAVFIGCCLSCFLHWLLVPDDWPMGSTVQSSCPYITQLCVVIQPSCFSSSSPDVDPGW